MKRIIICCDGTWNKPGQLDNGVEVRTNVQKLNSLLAPLDKHENIQLPYYHVGVGTGKNFFDKFFGGGFGSGLNKNIVHAYSFLVDNYNPGDQLYFLGFSRGAYTARSLVGFIRNCGILKNNDFDLIKKAFNKYRDRAEDSSPDSDEMIDFRNKYSYPLDRIKFIGVWDTVGALGIPVRWFQKFNLLTLNAQFHDCTLSSYIENAFHALAIDEKRDIFKATLWNQSRNVTKDKPQVLEQVWFPGVHSNVGGGYPDEGLSDISLLWMIRKAKTCGVNFDEEKIKQTVRPCVHAKLYESYGSFYKVSPPYKRPVYKGRNTLEMVHSSAVKRFESAADYYPLNLVHAFSGNVPLQENDIEDFCSGCSKLSLPK